MVGELIKDYRRKRKLTQKSLGAKIDMSVSQIKTYEQNIKTPSAKTAIRISKGFGPFQGEFIDEYISLTNGKAARSEKEQSLINWLESLGDDKNNLFEEVFMNKLLESDEPIPTEYKDLFLSLLPINCGALTGKDFYIFLNLKNISKEVKKKIFDVMKLELSNSPGK